VTKTYQNLSSIKGRMVINNLGVNHVENNTSLKDIMKEVLILGSSKKFLVMIVVLYTTMQ